MRRSLVTSLGLLAFVTAGCERYPEDPVFAYGRALQRDGAPRAGATLTLERQGGDGFAPLSTTTTESTGDYALEMLYGDAVGTARDSWQYSRLRLALPLEPDGSGASLAFFMDDDVELPTLQPWDAHPRVEDGAQGPAVAFPPAPPALPLPETATVLKVGVGDNLEDEEPLLPTVPEPLLWLTSGGALLWREAGMTSPWSPGPYVLEDFTAPQVQLRAASVGSWLFSPLGGENSSVQFQLEWRTGAAPLPEGSLRPISRDATCEPSFPDVCPWTDGRLTPVDFFEKETDPRAFSLVITLPRPARPRHAVVRGLKYLQGFEGKDWLVLEGSPDGEHWQRLARVVLRDLDSREKLLRSAQYSAYVESTGGDSPYGDGPLGLGPKAPVFKDVTLDDAGPTRFVRLSVETLTYDGSTQPAEFYTLSEVSIFE
ncbi:hypothetical protein [Corallococcus sp. Z5C101001]|uniref:hypothetical protein n=1 Tax=Corallococcus sp. Z5C101001 TaxID=2596829 RepID=UPI00117FD664|nr:hypothetical protein [Corallococcus sp. Z5C101001]TSC27448.1 hypothetical protein FOF48_18600 [Corallococcus sp. Z5C101001]